MVFYLGRDVKVYLTTEEAGSAVTVSGAGLGPYIDVVGVSNTYTSGNAGAYVSGSTPTVVVGGGDGVAGQGSITLTGNPTVDQTVKLTNTAGTLVTYTAKAVEDLTANQFTQASGAAANATSLGRCISHPSGHNNTIVVSDDGAGVLTLGQATAGIAGNTTITETLTSGTAVSFTGGTATGVAMTMTPVMSANGSGVTAVTITNSGSGYKGIPYLAFSTGTSGTLYGATHASGTITVQKGSDGYTIFADGLNWGASGTARVTDLTGVDLSIGAVDEDITYMGFRNITKAEIKKETTVSLTRKKPDVVWDKIWNDSWRCGVSGTSSAWSDLEGPKTNKGYRVYITLVSGTEVFTIPNTYISSHTISMNADGAADETLEFTTYITPSISTSAHTGSTTTTNL